LFIPSGIRSLQTGSNFPRNKIPDDKQLRGIRLMDVLEKRRLDQALNAKEFAVLTGVSCSTACGWFHLPRSPVFRGVIFWQDFVWWRTAQNGLRNAGDELPAGQHGNGSRCQPAAACRENFAGSVRLPGEENQSLPCADRE